MKKIVGLLMIFVMGSITYASDNRSAPNVFSSGSTISSSQMNENFNFLASEIREKDVYCDNGETISDAINDGFNSLNVHGDCNGAVGVYRLDPSVFGMSYSDLPNKPISFLLLNGANVIQFRDSGLTIGSNADGDLDIVSDGTAVDSNNLESAGGITLDAGTLCLQATDALQYNDPPSLFTPLDFGLVGFSFACDWA